MENQGFRLVEEKNRKSYFCPDFIDIYRGGHSFCVQQMFVDTKWWFVSMFMSIICSAFIFSTKKYKNCVGLFCVGNSFAFCISHDMDFRRTGLCESGDCRI